MAYMKPKILGAPLPNVKKPPKPGRYMEAVSPFIVSGMPAPVVSPPPRPQVAPPPVAPVPQKKLFRPVFKNGRTIFTI